MLKVKALMAISFLVLGLNGQEVKKVILLGDSIRMHYQTRVAAALKGTCDIWYPEENCQDTAFVLKNLDKWLGDKKADIVYLNCGLHDIYMDYPEKPRRSPEAYAKNLKEIFAKIKKLQPDAKIIFASTTPVNEEAQKSSKDYGRLVRRNSDVKAINEVAAKIAGEQKIKFDVLYSVLADDIAANIVADGVHPSGKGSSLLGKHVSTTIQEALTQ